MFQKTPRPVAKVMLERYLRSNDMPPLEAFDVAETDLNGDNLSEYVLRMRNCNEITKFCAYLVLAEKNNSFIELLFVEAKNVAISDSKSHGIHDILAIQSKKNDYEYGRYRWSPVDMKYIFDNPQTEGQ